MTLLAVISPSPKFIFCPSASMFALNVVSELNIAGTLKTILGRIGLSCACKTSPLLAINSRPSSCVGVALRSLLFSSIKTVVTEKKLVKTTNISVGRKYRFMVN